MSEYATIEHYVNHVMNEINKRDVEQISERLRAFGWEEVVRCEDCVHFGFFDDGEAKDYCDYVRGWMLQITPDGFCAWGESAWVTCKCGEELEAFGRVQTCPSCGRKVIA